VINDRPLKVLIVDDTIVYRKIVTDVLSDLPDVEVVGTAHNGKAAITKITSLKPDLLTLDIEMPEMDGYNLVKELVKLGLLGKPPVIVLSTEMDRNIIHDYNELGIEYVFQKPVNLRSFKQAVERSLKKYITGNN